MAADSGRIRVGIGGWTYEPWRGGNFYPQGLPHAKELEYASRRLSAIEINGTYYSLPSRASLARWRDETPDNFVFALKASRFATHRKILADAGEPIGRFIDSGIGLLGAKLGPILWQFMPSKRFDAEDFEAFLSLLPASADGVTLRHAIEVRHASFLCPAFVALMRRYRAAAVFTDSDEYPSFADLTGDFVYIRTMRSQAALAQGYEPAALDAIAVCARSWAGGEEPQAPRVSAQPAPQATPRDVFVFFISGAKERAPAAAMGLIDRLV